MKKLEEIFNHMIFREMALNLLLAIFGIIMVFYPKMTNKFAAIIVGLLFVVVGANMIYKYLKKSEVSLFSYPLIHGVLCILLGAIMIFDPFSYVFMITVGISIYFIIRGLQKLDYAIRLLRLKEKKAGIILLVSSILLIIMGVLMILDPFVTLGLTVLAGAFLILYSILDISDLFLIYKKSHDFIKLFK